MPIRTLTIAFVVGVVASACGSAAGGGSSTGATGRLRLHVVAGPVCPVVTLPPKPACRPRAVDGARIVLEGPMRVTIAVHGGNATIEVPPGRYTVTPRPVRGLMGTAPPATVSVVAGKATPLRLTYDTGIR